MGVDAAIAEAFLENPKFSPTRTTYLVGELERLSGVAGRDLYVQRAAALQSEAMAYFFERRALMHVAYHRSVAPLRRFVSPFQLPFAQAQDGRVVILVPLDHLVWTRDIAAIVDAANRQMESLGATGVALWVSGTLSPLARGNIEAMGWEIVEHAYTRLQPAG